MDSLKSRSLINSCGVLPCVLSLALAGCSSRAPARTFADLQQRVRPGQTVYVIDDTGTESRGTLTSLSPTQLSYDVNGIARQLDAARVRQVQRYGDSLWNGTLIGVLIALPGMLIADPQYKPCTTDPSGRCAENDAAYRVAAVGIFGAIGAGIDALMRSRHQLFLAPGQPSARRDLRVEPVLQPNAAGIAVVVKF